MMMIIIIIIIIITINITIIIILTMLMMLTVRTIWGATAQLGPILEERPLCHNLLLIIIVVFVIIWRFIIIGVVGFVIVIIIIIIIMPPWMNNNDNVDDYDDADASDIKWQPFQFEVPKAGQLFKVTLTWSSSSYLGKQKGKVINLFFFIFAEGFKMKWRYLTEA